MAIAIVNTSATQSAQIFPEMGWAHNIGFTPTAGNNIFGLIGLRNDSGFAAGISGITGTNWTTTSEWAVIPSASIIGGPSNRMYCGIWRAIVPPSPGTTLTVGFAQNTANYYTIQFIEVSGLSGTPIDRVATGSSPAATDSLVVVAGGANAQNNELVLATMVVDVFSATGGATTATTDYTNVGTVNNADYPSYNSSRKILSAGETTSATWSGIDDSIAQGIYGVLVTLKEAGSPSPKPRMSLLGVG